MAATDSASAYLEVLVDRRVEHEPGTVVDGVDAQGDLLVQRQRAVVGRRRDDAVANAVRPPGGEVAAELVSRFAGNPGPRPVCRQGSRSGQGPGAAAQPARPRTARPTAAPRPPGRSASTSTEAGQGRGEPGGRQQGQARTEDRGAEEGVARAGVGRDQIGRDDGPQRAGWSEWSASLQSRRITIVYAASISRSEVNPTRAATLVLGVRPVVGDRHPWGVGFGILANRGQRRGQRVIGVVEVVDLGRGGAQPLGVGVERP